MKDLLLKIPDQLTVALGKRLPDIEKEIRLASAFNLYKEGRLSSGMAAQLAGMSRVKFLIKCGEYDTSIFQQTPEELDSDVNEALNASNN